MAQGTVKPKKVAAKNPNSFGPKTGNRIIKPKKLNLISQNKIKKKATCGLINETEKLLGSKAGHLEMLRGGKREKKLERLANEKKAEAAKVKKA